MSCNAECALSCDGEHRDLVGRVRLYGKYVIVLDLDTPILEPVKQLMLLLKAFKLFRFVCGISVLPKGGIRIRIRDGRRLDDVFQTLRRVVGSPKSFGSVPRQSWIDRKMTFEVEFYGTPPAFEVTLQHLPEW
jgi:hypothetical protein